MAIKPSGSPLSLSEIQAEFGGSNPISLSEYYRGGGLVPNGPTANNGIATSGAISMGSFYGAVKEFVFNQTISANTNNYSLRDAAIGAGWNGSTPLRATVTINSGVVVGSPSTVVHAFDTGASFPAGSSLALVNNGFIIGMGGGGGAGSRYSVAGSAGVNGGPALRAAHPISITNNGTIAGGGGGGGGGRGTDFITSDGKGTATGYYGGGGGGGRTGTFSAGGGSPSGGAGSFSSAGAGAVIAGPGGARTGGGGNGGDWGASGGSGGNPADGSSWFVWGGQTGPGPYGGGAGGAAVSGNANINWVTTGTRLGAIS